MKLLVTLVVVVLASLVAIGFFIRAHRKNARVPLDVQLAAFEHLGLRLRPGVTKEDLFNIWPLESLEKFPYQYLYSAFGDCDEMDENAHFSDRIWYFDTEGVIEELEYDKLLANIARISGGDLKISNIKTEYKEDETDPVAIVTFELNGSRFNWTIHQYTDWNSAAFLTPINSYAQKHGLRGRLVWNRSWGQDWALGWHTPEQIKGLQELGVTIEEVSPTITARPREK